MNTGVCPMWDKLLLRGVLSAKKQPGFVYGR